MKLNLNVVMAALVLTFSSAAWAQQIVVPAYWGFSTAQNQSDWSRIQNAANMVQIVVVEYGQVNASPAAAQAQLSALRNLGQLVLGYVTTNGGTRSAGVVLNGGDGNPNDDRFTSVAAWYGNYPGAPGYTGSIDGIFFDVGPSDDSTQAYYSNLYQTVTGQHGGRCSTHACVMLNASQFPKDWVLGVADYLTLWELPVTYNTQSYVYNFCPSPTPTSTCASYQQDSVGQANGWYFTAANAPRSTHVVTNATSADVDSVVCASSSRNYPSVYIYDGSGASYGHLSVLFEQTLASISGPDASTLWCGTHIYDACGNDTGYVGSHCDDPLARCNYCGLDYWVCTTTYC